MIAPDWGTAGLARALLFGNSHLFVSRSDAMYEYRFNEGTASWTKLPDSKIQAPTGVSTLLQMWTGNQTLAIGTSSKQVLVYGMQRSCSPA